MKFVLLIDSLREMLGRVVSFWIILVVLGYCNESNICNVKNIIFIMVVKLFGV